jgi:hypothetical protein
MRWFPLSLGLVGALGAQAPLHVVSVERRGLPPFEPGDRAYCLDGGQNRGLHVGDRLLVKRAGEALALGHLKVTSVRTYQAETRFEPLDTAFPMKGDLALQETLRRIPEMPRLETNRIPLPSAPEATHEAPPREGLIFFLPQQGDLSPAGQKKLETWLEAWGTGGRWAIQVPTSKGVKPALQKKRTETLVAALRSLGVEHPKIETEPRTTEGRYDPAWVRRWD